MNTPVKFQLIDVNSGEIVCTSPVFNQKDSYELGLRKSIIETLEDIVTNDDIIPEINLVETMKDNTTRTFNAVDLYYSYEN
jgi:hypothetical protein